MANNRMYLVHGPTGLAVYLGKRMGYGWYGTPDHIKDSMDSLFDLSEQYGVVEQDHFYLAMEDPTEAPGAIDIPGGFSPLRPLGVNGLRHFAPRPVRFACAGDLGIADSR